MTKAQFLPWFDEVLQPTESIFRRVPSDKLDFRITGNSFSVGQLLSHIPGSISFFARVINQEELPYKSLREIMVANRRQPSATVEESVQYLVKGRTSFTEAVDRLSEERFQSEMLDTPQKGHVFYWRYCAFAIEHHIHHLMELHISLKVLGIDVNTRSLYAG